jgi:hypothetical protein
LRAGFGPTNLSATYVLSYGQSSSGAPAWTNSNCSVVSFTAMECYDVVGVGTSFYLAVSVAQQATAVAGNTLSFMAPSVYDIAPMNVSTAGGANFTVTGANFGPSSASGFWNTLSLNAVITWGPAALACTVLNDTTMVCPSTEGTGGPYGVSVVIGGQPGDVNLTTTPAYSVPEVTGAPADLGTTRGYAVVTVSGRSAEILRPRALCVVSR